uniref:D-aminoacyl-tRNA deacylase n=1 Tax=Chromera velia CCMP2878 TaxID=1169474 RepID=A0A0G4HT98_9ALVE|mmetsp:Transcript_46684/g.92174  ORF Transcript_46684/g.92174 Transcript_46684/m.92174 type:complete len:175 (+) Transcript_46684:313-837(+)|eukprot:Cvel_8427.t1-p1 / transcript=Cvel_8427.t1 / gene=Cvel_8427 / organism=Chromera_velia_CCMP2878 / gene_product=Probable D-tyrosyl-tRNA(Tyr) deacylase 2, putative / transcript_product=Probable D-tyrosyl-tRNA(Tyr) deacylase 2, putative / location=Cvel_scaffold465:56113-57836(-) / protein_length=174 / sequence_SO=supercontig / SO=protein_coding / is_pseudo=false
MDDDRRGGGSTIGARVVLQSVDEASLLIDNRNQWVSMKNGVIVFIAFLNGARDETVERIVDIIFTCNFVEQVKDGQRKFVNIKEAGADFGIMLVPQAALAGKLKGSRMQFHSLLEQDRASLMWSRLSAHTQKLSEEYEKVTPGREITVLPGVYGNRQGLQIKSSGPNSMYFEVS